jgi:hypothetical protein
MGCIAKVDKFLKLDFRGSVVAEEPDEATLGGSKVNPSGGIARAAVPIGVKSGVFCKEDAVDP